MSTSSGFPGRSGRRARVSPGIARVALVAVALGALSSTGAAQALTHDRLPGDDLGGSFSLPVPVAPGAGKAVSGLPAATDQGSGLATVRAAVPASVIGYTGSTE